MLEKCVNVASSIKGMGFLDDGFYFHEDSDHDIRQFWMTREQ